MGGGLLAAHGLESLKLSAMNTGGLNMYCLIRCSNITDDMWFFGAYTLTLGLH